MPWLLSGNYETVDLLLERWGYWARPRLLYRRARSAEGAWRSPQVFGLPDPRPRALQMYPDERFGWRVECCWRELANAQKWLLSEWYIHLRRDDFGIRRACRKAKIPRDEHRTALQQAINECYRSYLTLILD